MSEDRKVMLIYTGGTIGMVPDPATGTLRPFSIKGLVERIPELDELNCSIKLESFESPVDSSDMNIGRWQQIGDLIHENYNRFDGFVVLHGSDTMAFSAAVLSFMLENIQKPVVFTGSQLPIGVMRSDARENLLTALEIATAYDEEGAALVPEVSVYFEYDLYRGNRVHKENTQDFEAFRSPNFPKLAESGVQLKFSRDKILKRPGTFQYYRELDPRVGVIYIYPGISPELIRHQLKAPQFEAFILLSFGTGNLPTDPEFIAALESALRQGKVLVNVSQCRMGSVVHGQYGASELLEQIGVISGGDILLEAAWAKLMHLLGRQLDIESIKKEFLIPICGEMST